MPSLPYWLFPGDDRPPAEIDDEVAEELRLHLELLAEERMLRGSSPDEARRQAAERFGDFDSLVRRCRREKQGDALMLKRAQTVLTLLLLAVVGWMAVRDYQTSAATAAYMDQTTTLLRTINADLAELRGTGVGEPSPADGAPVDRERRVSDALRTKERIEFARQLLTQSELALEAAEGEQRSVQLASESTESANKAKLKQAELALDSAETTRQTAEAKGRFAEADLERKQELHASGLETNLKLQEVEAGTADVRAQAQIAKNEVEAARAALERVKSENKAMRSEWDARMARAQSKVDKARSDVAKARATLDSVEKESSAPTREEAQPKEPPQD